MKKKHYYFSLSLVQTTLKIYLWYNLINILVKVEERLLSRYLKKKGSSWLYSFLLQNCFNWIIIWCVENWIQLGGKTTTVIKFHFIMNSNVFNFQLDNMAMKRTFINRDLGVLPNSNLSLHNNIDVICNWTHNILTPYHLNGLLGRSSSYFILWA